MAQHKESTCQHRRHRFSPWSRNTPHAVGQVSLSTAATEAWALWRDATAMKSPCTTAGERPPQQQRPSVAKHRNKLIKQTHNSEIPPETRQDGYYQKNQKVRVSEAVKELLVWIPLPPTAEHRITTCSINSTSGDAMRAGESRHSDFLHTHSYRSIFMGSQGNNTEVVCHSLLHWTTFCHVLSPPWPVHLGWPLMAWLSWYLVNTGHEWEINISS